MGLLCLTAAVFLLSVSGLVSGLRIANHSSLTCSQKNLPCKVNINDCLYQGWLKPNKFTPTGPMSLEVGVDVKKDEHGDWVPVIVAEWKARDDGSILFLNGTELQVTRLAGGGHLCVHYIFLQKFQLMRNPDGNLWTFSLDKVAVDPGMQYIVSVSNLPKPNIDQTDYHIAKQIVIPDCEDPAMQRTRFCIERGIHWQPNIRPGQDGRRLFVTFNTAMNSDMYKVVMSCGETRSSKLLSKNNGSSLNVTFDLEDWPYTCCSFTVKIQPFFEKCGNDCTQNWHNFNICSTVVSPPSTPANPWIWVVFAGLMILFFGVCAIGVICLRRRKDDEGLTKNPAPSTSSKEVPVAAERSVLIIYSRDHPKYTDIVLKLCAFLRAKCGTEVYLDLLDTASIGAMGRLPWTEFQKRRIEQSSDKVLVLCSRGVQAKWGAMCGGPQVNLREDIRSPMGDMLTYALQLITPDMQRPASYGKYLVAYFEDISGERDVPSMFDISIKYKLMKHFEELFFRILDLEKYQRGKVHTIEGIGIDEYFKCPSGNALREAIESFQAYQLENPDWFEKECVDSEEEALAVEISPLIDQHVMPIRQCEPVLNDGPSVYECEVELHDVNQALSVQTTEIPYLNLEYNEQCVEDLQPAHNIFYPAVELPAMEVLPGINTAVVHPPGLNSPSCYMAEPALHDYLAPSRSGYFANTRSQADGCSADDLEEDLENLRKLQVSLVSFEMAAPPPSLDDHLQTSWDMQPSQPMEMDETEVPDTSGNRQSRWSDQGYSSRDSIVKEEPPQASLAALAKLQQVLYLNSPISSGFCTETIES